MKKVVVFGADGTLGSKCCKIFEVDYEVVPVTKKHADLKDGKSIDRVLNINSPDIVINCAAITDLEYCETHREECMEVNAYAPERMATWCMMEGSKFISFSTAFVFDGSLDLTKSYTETDEINPIQIYGESKAKQEELIQKLPFNDWCIIRTDWVYGKNGKGTFERMLKKALNKQQCPIADGKIGSPTYAKRLAEQTKVIVENNVEGIVHAVGGGACSKWKQVVYCLGLLAADVYKAIPVTDNYFDIGYRLPQNTNLENKCLKELGLDIMGSWEDEIEDFLSTEIVDFIGS